MLKTKTILIPIDFRVASLNYLKIALENLAEERVNVVLVYAEHQSDAIGELLFYSADRRIDSLSSPQFREALEVIRNRFESKLNHLAIQLFHGYTLAAFKNMLEGNGIDEIIVPKNYRFDLSGRAFSLIPMIRKTILPTTEIEWKINVNTTGQEQLHALFN